jgi:hypothetical protein
LEAESVSIGIVEIHLLHAVVGDDGFFCLDALASQLFIGGVYIRATEVKPDIGAIGGWSAFRFRRAILVGLEGSVEH